MASKELKVLIWIRRDRETGELSEVKGSRVDEIAKIYYNDPELAMGNAREDMPITNGFADYWPKTK